MSIKWTIAILMFMLLSTMVFAIVEKGTSDVEGTGVLETLAEIRVQDIVSPVNWVMNFFSGKSLDWAKSLLDAALFNYTMFEIGPWQWIKYFFWTISFAWLITTVVALGRGTSQS